MGVRQGGEQATSFVCRTLLDVTRARCCGRCWPRMPQRMYEPWRAASGKPRALAGLITSDATPPGERGLNRNTRILPSFIQSFQSRSVDLDHRARTDDPVSRLSSSHHQSIAAFERTLLRYSPIKFYQPSSVRSSAEVFTLAVRVRVHNYTEVRKTDDGLVR